MQKLQAEHYLIVTLAVMGLVTFSRPLELAQLAVSVVAAAVIDFFLTFLRTKTKQFPVLAVISGLIIGLLLKPDLLLAAAAAAIAMLSKHIIRFHGRNIFNPAAFGLTATLLVFSAVTTWWGAVHWLIVPLGLLVAWRIGRLLTSFSFLVVYVILSFVVGLPSYLDFTIYFFAFVMVLEPVTSPFAKKGKIIFGALVAVLAYLFASISGIDALLLALLAMNIFTYWLNKMK